MLIAVTPHFKIWRFFAHNSLRNYTYVLQEKAKGHAAVIDPWDGDELISWAAGQEIKLSFVINTHGHHDHIRGNQSLLEQGAQLAGTALGLQSIPLPGHTLDHVGFLLVDGREQHFFAGDTLFHSGVGNCKHGGDVEALFHSIQLLHHLLSPDTMIHPGHDYRVKNSQFADWVEPRHAFGASIDEDLATVHSLPAATWREECAHNPFLRLTSPQLRQQLLKLCPDLTEETLSDQIIFHRLRLLRDQF